jgi:hypothetical protein
MLMWVRMARNFWASVVRKLNVSHQLAILSPLSSLIVVTSSTLFLP